MSKMYYYKQASALNRELKQELGSEFLAKMHEKDPVKHFAIAIRQFLIMVLMPVLIYFFDAWYVWIPVALLQGVVIFSFTVLLHEVVHKCVFRKDHKGAYRILGLVYGTFSGLAASQFTRWHMDHHNELGTEDKDPKRAFLSPKNHAAWYKALYATPILYPIYFRAAAKAAAGYEPELVARIKKERLLSISWHLGVMACFAYFVSPLFALKAWAIPIFIFFPMAFMLNRLGQHYVIDPSDVAKWSTLMRPNGFWNVLFLYSSYHLEHHYFPAVPFYRLGELQKGLDPFYERRGVRAYGYGELLYLWFVKKHVPHTSANV